MKICHKCNLSFSDDANNCPQCGEPLTYVDVQAQKMADSTDHTAEFDKKDISDNKVLAMIPYLMSWVGIVITLLAAGTSAYAGFHVRQALKIQICSILFAFVSPFLLLIPILGVIAVAAVAIVLFVLNIIGFVNVCMGKAKEPPIISSFGFLK